MAELRELNVLHRSLRTRRSSDLATWQALPVLQEGPDSFEQAEAWLGMAAAVGGPGMMLSATALRWILRALDWILSALGHGAGLARSEEHTSELQSLMRNSYAVLCLKKKTHNVFISSIINC